MPRGGLVNVVVVFLFGKDSKGRVPGDPLILSHFHTRSLPHSWVPEGLYSSGSISYFAFAARMHFHPRISEQNISRLFYLMLLFHR